MLKPNNVYMASEHFIRHFFPGENKFNVLNLYIYFTIKILGHVTERIPTNDALFLGT
jgi:hypothetical protein